MAPRGGRGPIRLADWEAGSRGGNIGGQQVKGQAPGQPAMQDWGCNSLSICLC